MPSTRRPTLWTPTSLHSVRPSPSITASRRFSDNFSTIWQSAPSSHSTQPSRQKVRQPCLRHLLFGTLFQQTPQLVAFGQPPTCPSDSSGRYSVSHQHIIDPNLITQHSFVAKQHGLPTLLRQLFGNLTDGTTQPLDSTNSSMIEAAMPKTSALCDPLTAGSSVFCINSFVPSDDYLCEKINFFNMYSRQQPPSGSLHSHSSRLVFCEIGPSTCASASSRPSKNQPFFQPTTNMYFGESRPLFGQPQHIFLRKLAN